MEFIQCQHCKKQYAVSDKLRAATGKRIRCKHCSQPFEIIVQTRSTKAEPEISTASPKATSPEVAPRKETKTTTPAMPEPNPVASTLADPISSEPIPSEPFPSEQAEPPALQTSSTGHVNDDLFDLSTYSSESYLDASETTQKPESEQDVARPNTTEQTAIDAPDETAETDNDAETSATKVKPDKKTFNIQLLITIVLAITLLVAGIAAFLFLTESDLFRVTAKKETQSIVTEDIFKPIEIKIAEPKPEPRIKEKINEPTPAAIPELASNITHQRAKAPIIKAKLKPAKVFKPSQVCKDVSAEYWVRSHTLATSSLDTKTYMTLLDQNLVQADEIRRACKDKTLVGIVSKAARTGNRLNWIKQEISIVMDKADTEKRPQTEE